ncbi:MAG: N-acetylmuramoyl-L-alanine amidase family protein, partial [Clostridium sp.]|nr:N-acetylmuramoyl-L-alanine amidase family protein [Clostridium sp.]
NKISMKKYKMANVRETLEGGEKVTKKAIELDKDFDAVDDEDMKNFCIDTYGNLWILSKGKVKTLVNGELETVYKVDGTMDKLSVFDKNSMIIWSSDEEIYSVVNNAQVSNEESTTDSENEVNESEETKEEVKTEAGNEPAIKTGWIKNADGSWSYNNLDGTSATGWIKDNDKWYYLNSNGIMSTGWVKDGADWYYLNASGDMKTGWFKDNNGTWYYLNESGKMAYSTIVDGYELNASGAWINK